MTQPLEKLNSFVSAMLTEAQSEADEILRKAEAEEKTALDEYEAALAAKSAEQKTARAAAAALQSAKRLASARLKCRRELLEERERCAALVYDAVRARLETYTAAPGYGEALVKLARAGAESIPGSGPLTVSLRAQDLHFPERFAAKLRELVDYYNHLLRTWLQADAVDFGPALAPFMANGQIQYDAVLQQAMQQAEAIRPMLADVSRALNEAHHAGANILFEGAQGTLLDIDHGTYPFVTSSNCVAGNAAAGAGVGPSLLHYVLGITKAYCTRVGGGPFPTELDWDTPGTPGYHMATIGAEKGTTTGRSRRCGWFDAALLKRSAQLNGMTGLCITKLDVLDGLPELKLCTGYLLDGQTTDILPLGAEAIARCTPIYETLPGWSESTVGVTEYDRLPVAARQYLERIEEIGGVPVHLISTSPDRAHTILRRHPFAASAV